MFFFDSKFYTRQAGEWLQIHTRQSKISLAMASVASVISTHAILTLQSIVIHTETLPYLPTKRRHKNTHELKVWRKMFTSNYTIIQLSNPHPLFLFLATPCPCFQIAIVAPEYSASHPLPSRSHKMQRNQMKITHR